MVIVSSFIHFCDLVCPWSTPPFLLLSVQGVVYIVYVVSFWTRFYHFLHVFCLQNASRALHLLLAMLLLVSGFIHFHKVSCTLMWNFTLFLSNAPLLVADFVEAGRQQQVLQVGKPTKSTILYVVRLQRWEGGGDEVIELPTTEEFRSDLTLLENLSNSSKIQKRTTRDTPTNIPAYSFGGLYWVWHFSRGSCS